MPRSVPGMPLIQRTNLRLPYGAPAFDPGDYGPVALWLVGDDAPTGNVATWPRRKYGSDATQATVAKQPVGVVGALNGHKAVQFDGVDDYLVSASSSAQPFTVFVSAVWLGNGYSIPISRESSGICYLARNAPNQWELYAGNGISGGSGPGSDPVCVTAVINGVNSAVYKNGIAEVSGNTGTSFLDGVRVGMANNNSAPFTGSMFGILVFSQELSTTQVLDVSRRFMADCSGVAL